VGPHPHWSCQLSFETATRAADSLVDERRQGLTVLVHDLAAFRHRNG
jgi:hypothetical protein